MSIASILQVADDPDDALLAGTGAACCYAMPVPLP